MGVRLSPGAPEYNLEQVLRRPTELSGYGVPTSAEQVVGASPLLGTKSMKPGFVYIIQRVEKDEFYVGSAYNPKLRLAQHNRGNVKATKYKRPYKLVFQQEFDSLDQAKKVEYKLKSWKRKDFVEKIVNDQKIKFIVGA